MNQLFSVESDLGTVIVTQQASTCSIIIGGKKVSITERPVSLLAAVKGVLEGEHIKAFTLDDLYGNVTRFQGMIKLTFCYNIQHLTLDEAEQFLSCFDSAYPQPVVH